MTLTQIKPAGLSKPIDLGDNERIRLGDGNDIQIYHDGTNSIIQNSTGYFVVKAPNTSALYIQGVSVVAQPSGGGDIYFAGYKDGGFFAYYDNSLKLQTTASSVLLSDNLVMGNHHIELNDNSQIMLGNAADLRIYHDGNSSFILNTSGDLTLIDESRIKLRTDQFVVNNYANNESIIYAAANGEVSLYHNNVKRIDTTGTGAKIFGQLNFDDGSSTANTNGIGFGSSQDCRLFHNGTSFQVRNVTGPITFITPTHFQISADSSNDTMFKAIQDGGVELYHDNTKRLETTNNGVEVTGRLDVILTGSPALHVGGSVYYLKIGQDSTNSSPKIDAIGSVVAIPFELNGVEKARISANGGITFNGDTAAANGLDDYEEGTWSPVLGSHSDINNTNGSQFDTTETFNSGWYTKVGDMVTVSVVCANIHTNHADHVLRRISGLPYTASGGMQCTVSAHIAEQRGLRFVYSTSIEEANNFSLWGQVAAGHNYITLHASKHTSPYSGWPALFNSTTQSARIALQLTYKAA